MGSDERDQGGVTRDKALDFLTTVTSSEGDRHGGVGQMQQSPGATELHPPSEGFQRLRRI